ncbi:MAG TPA: ATP-binding protein [Rhodanobacteraceae bacterium]|nr:ATP-binding protein [Rhodanobacteraceae bacterium]
MLDALLLGALLAAASPVPAPVLPPTPRFRTYGVADGLPSNRIYATAQDAAGYLWIGAGDGLVRFDGQHFTVWRHHADDPASLASNDVSALLIDRDGAVWAGGEGGGVNRYDPVSNGFRHWRHGPAADSLASDDVTAFAQDLDGSIWVGMYAAGVDHLRADGSGFEHLRHRPGDPASLVADNVLGLLATNDGALWIGTDSGLDLRHADGRIEHIRFEGETKPVPVWQVAADPDGLRVATAVGLFRVGADRIARRWPAGSARQMVLASLRLPNGDLWVSAANRLLLYDHTGKALTFPTQPLLNGGFHGHYANNLMRDREGGLWVSTVDAGLAYLGPDWRVFSHFGHIPEDPASLTLGGVVAMAVDAQGRVLLGGESGMLDRFDPTSGRIEHLGASLGPDKPPARALAVAGERIWAGTPRDVRVLDHGSVRTLTSPQLRRGAMWLVFDRHGDAVAAALGHGMLRIDHDSFEVSTIPLPNAGAKAAETEQLLRYGDTIWRGSGAGLTRLAADGSRFETVPGITPGWVHAFALRGDQLWVARDDVLESYRLHDGRAERQRVIDAAAGWPQVDVNRIALDDSGRVWLTSRTGLWCFDASNGQFRHYGVADGLPTPEFTRGLLQLPNDTVYAGTSNGVVGFRADTHFQPLPPPLLHLTRVAVRRAGAVVALPTDGSDLHLGWNDHDLTVTVQALSYVAPKRTQYRFRMDGFDSGWVVTGSSGKREFTGLRAGRYRLHIEAMGPRGDWTALAPLTVEVSGPPWLRPWAWLLYGVALLALAALIWRAVRQRLERRVAMGLLEQKREFAEQASAAKTRFLATLGHEIRTPMTGVLGMAELLTHTALDGRQRGMVDTIERSGSVLLKLVNDALDLARIEAGRLELDPQPFDPAALLQEVIALESGLARGKGLELTADVAGGVPARMLGDAVRVRQILLNLVNNAIKFTEQGAVRVTLALHDGALRYSVSDNGPGLTPALRQRLFHRFEQGDSGAHSSGSGLGLAICRELATLMGGQIEVDSEPGHGCTFHALLPLPAVAAAAPATSARQPMAARDLVVVEDDDTVAAVIVGLLEAQGHRVRRAGDALAALAEFQLHPCDAMLVDLDLPAVDGFQLIAMLREQPGGAELAVLVVTARSAADDEARARAAGADGFLRKPVSGDDLAAALRAVERIRGA